MSGEVHSKKHPGGRPTKYSRDLALKICQLTAEGNSLIKICSEEGMPGYSTVLAWKVSENPDFKEFQELYAKAKQDQADTLAEEILDIADDTSNDYKTIVKDGREVEVVDHEHIQRSRLRVDTRKWIAAKLKPKSYGEKVDLEHSGNLVNVTVAADKKTLSYLSKHPELKDHFRNIARSLKND